MLIGEDDPAARYISARGVVWEMDTNSTFDLALKCVNDCSRHEGCERAEPSSLPRRVIDCTDLARPRLVISDASAKELYVALSYVWGEEQPHRTTTKNFHRYTQAIDPSLIPKTIRDAIAVTHKLDLRYLWVDAFCIIQDSEEDKIREIPRIRSTFHNAFITIVAAGSKKVSDGFLHDRPKWFFAPSTLPFRCPDGSVGTMILGVRESPPDEPVDARAWCLEERLLSPRKLMYCTHALHYECRSIHINVNGSPDLLPSVANIPRLPNNVFARQKVIGASRLDEITESWRYALKLYTQRALTESRDRLVALSGVVEEFHKHWSHSDYVAGLWTHQLPGALLWAKVCNREHPRPPKYRAPSWSWAAVDGQITSVHEESKDMACEIKHLQIDLKTPSIPYGQVTGGFLVLSAIIRMAVWIPEESELFEKDPNASRGVMLSSHEDSEKGEIGYVTADAIEEVSESTCDVVVAIVSVNRATILGLVLVPVFDDPNNNTYRRVGWFTAPFCDRVSWLNTVQQVVRII